MIARLAGLFTISMLTTGVAMGPVVAVTPARELQAASRVASDGDLQADWSTPLAARVRRERLAQHKDIGALVHYHLGYLEWQLSSLVCMSTVFRGQTQRVPVTQAKRPAATTSETGTTRTLSALARVRMSFVVSEWLEAVWAAMRSVFEYGNAWSRALLFSRGLALDGI